MIFRNMFKKIFNKNPTYTDGKNLTRFLSLNNSVNLFAAADKKIYQNLFARTCIHAIAENGAKLKPKVIRVQGGRQVMANRPKLQRLLDLQPNEYMNTFDFLYKVITLLYIDNNVFIYIKRNAYTGEVEGLYPINYSCSEVLEANGIMYVRFTFFTGFTMVCAYDELVHLRRFYGEDDLFGASEKALTKHIGLLNILDAGLAASANSANYLRGILKFNINLQQDDLRAQKEAFVKDYMNINNNGGIGALDSRMEFQELTNNFRGADNEQMQTVRNDVMSYFGVNEKIISSAYNEEDWAAFYESVLEPVAIRLGLELTRKVFTARELEMGNQIIFEANRLQYSSNESKVSLLKELLPMGLLSINEGREIFNMAPIEGGDKHILSLNYIDADKATEYQLGSMVSGKKKKGEEENNVG